MDFLNKGVKTNPNQKLKQSHFNCIFIVIPNSCICIYYDIKVLSIE